jgi:hypothetical protein
MDRGEVQRGGEVLDRKPFPIVRSALLRLAVGDEDA